MVDSGFRSWTFHAARPWRPKCQSSVDLSRVPSAHPTRAISQPIQPSPLGTRSIHEPTTSDAPARYSSQQICSVFTVSIQASWVPTKSLQSSTSSRRRCPKRVAVITESVCFGRGDCRTGSYARSRPTRRDAAPRRTAAFMCIAWLKQIFTLSSVKTQSDGSRMRRDQPRAAFPLVARFDRVRQFDFRRGSAFEKSVAVRPQRAYLQFLRE